MVSKITLSEYINQIGENQVAKIATVSISTVRSWRYLNRVPRVKQAKRLIHCSFGLLTWESIYGPVEALDSDRAIPENMQAPKKGVIHDS